MINRLVIRGFKSLVDVDVPLGAVNVFVGANGTGKSNLLEALGIIGAAAQGRIDDESLLKRGVRPGITRLFQSAFDGKAEPGPIDILAATQGAHYRMGILPPVDRPLAAWRFLDEDLTNSGVSLARRNKDEPQPNDEAGFAALKIVGLDAQEPAAVLMKDLAAYAVFGPSTPMLRGLMADYPQRDPVGLAGGRLPEAFDEMLKANQAGDDSAFDVFQDVKNLIEWVDDIETVLTTEAPIARTVPQVGRTALLFHDRFMRADHRTLTAYDASEGALYVLFAAVMAAHPRSPFLFAIDNFDHGLNPRLARRLTQQFTRWVLHFNRQAFLTAHSPQVLDGLPLDDGRVRLFTLDRTSRGRTVVNQIDVARVLAEKAKREGATLSQLWLSGVLGGMPNV